ncbi:MAG TPA: M1 family aminopeptidase [Terriglobales bacterium]|nr:M1 family aminopeptidase [Terriglobales bacterium]
MKLCHSRQAHRALGLAVVFFLVFFLTSVATRQAIAAEKTRMRVDDYQIDVELLPQTHKLTARATVKVTALEDLSVATFQLNNALRITKLTDASNKPLAPERNTQDSTVRIALTSGIAKNASTSFYFEYEGTLESADDSPVQGLKLAYVGPDTSYLLYSGLWFPVAGYGVNRFTATINVTVPAHMVVIGSGKEPATTAPASANPKKPATALANAKTFTFAWDKPSFPGTIIAGTFQEFKSDEAGIDLHVFFKPNHQALGAEYASTAVKAFTYFVTQYGNAPSTRLKVVELPDDTVPAAWAPEIAALASRAITEKVNYRLLANTIAHQWWGVSVSPASKDDWWISDGFSRYSEARYVESAAGAGGLEEMVKDMSVGALAYDSVPLSSADKLDYFSPEFQSLVTDKGAMILHMLRWVVGEKNYLKLMRDFAAKYAGKSASTDDFRELSEKVYGEKLTWFYSQWMDSTSAPEFKSKYTVYRLGSNKGFRIVGAINQDLDLFRMPVNLRIDTDGKTEEKRIDVVGTNSPFSVETFGRPRRISIDPENRVLTNSADIKLRSSIVRGQGLTQQGDLAGALLEFNKALEVNKNSSLAHYRIAEVFFLQKNYQASANAYRESLNGDGEPRWTEVWSHLQLGKIFDITGQRDRAVNEYRQAIQTNDNTQGALDECRRYMQKPYEREEKEKEGN